MDPMNWVWAAVALSAGLVFGELAGRLARSALVHAEHRSSASAATVVPKVIFWSSVLIGLVLAAAALKPSTINRLADRLGDSIPDLIIAAAWLIGGYAVSVVVAMAIGQSALKATGVRQLALEHVLRVTIMVAAIGAALNEAGVSSQIVLVFVATGVIAPVITITVLTILGGREVAAQIAAGRVVAHHLHPGDRIVCMGQQGLVTRMHTTCVEVSVGDGTTTQIPNSQLLTVGFTVSDRQRSPI